MKKKILIKPGMIFNKLKAIKYTHTGKHNRRYFIFLCDCGNKIEVTAEAAISGNTKSCGCIRRESTIKRYNLKPGQAAMRQLILQSYKKHKNKKWELTEEEFYNISQMNCYYCGSKPYRIKKSNNKTGDFIYNGIDRIDSSKGYEINNVVPCCRKCNVAKNDMSVKEFKDWILKISAMAEQWG